MQMNKITVDLISTLASPNVARPQNNGSRRHKIAKQFTYKKRIIVMELHKRGINIVEEWSKEFGLE
jgi:ubiquitin-protein ligase